MHVATDPELAPLLARPELASIRSPQLGTVAAVHGFDAGIAYAPTHNLLAITAGEHSWGSCNWDESIALQDVATNAIVATLPLVLWSESNPECDDRAVPVLPSARGAVAARRARALAVLAELGFDGTATQPGTDATTSADGTFRSASVPAAHLGVIDKDGELRVLRKNTLLATGPGLEKLGAVTYVPAAHALAIGTYRAGREGCEGADPTQTTVLAVPRAAP